MSLDFSQKVAVITGAGNGLGASGAGEGSDATVADTVVADIKAPGGDAVAKSDRRSTTSPTPPTQPIPAQR